MDLSVMGLPLESDMDCVQPLSALVIVKGLDALGDVCYWTSTTEGLTSVEAWGMAEFAAHTAREGGSI